MATITVVPSGVSFDVAPGETVIEAAWRGGYFWPTVCGGQGMCKTCVFQVIDGADVVGEIDEYEREGLELIQGTLPGDPDSYRLACMARVNGDLTARKIGVRPRT